ncbi:GNAT family N-acetyltransferase [Lentibacillus halophilus]|uniref:GNAT family N-acetyltransferase n=1 Tax=Lentibacillus halophilus TaxID=295065 RepID=A0ABP3J291_9BACI
MAIKKAGREALEFIYNHAAVVQKEATAGYMTPRTVESVVLSDTLAGGGYYLVYEDGMAIKGWIGIGKMTDPLTEERTGMISELYVFPLYRRQGIGQKLCKEACRQLKRDGYSKVQLNVFEGNDAQTFYKRLGFTEVSTLMEKIF